MSNAKKETFPKVIAHDRIKTLSVKIYCADNGGKEEFTLVYYNQSGERKRIVSRNLDALEARAGEVLNDLAGGKSAEANALTAADREEFANLRAIFGEVNATPLVLARHAVEAVKILGADLLIEAARAYQNRHTLQRRTVKETVDELITVKQNRNRSAVHVAKLTQRLNAFAGSCVNVNISDVTHTILQAFLDGINGSPRTYNNYRADLIALFNFAKSRKYIAQDWNEFSAIEKEDAAEEEIETFTPSELKNIFADCQASEKYSGDLTAFVALGAFAGLRTSEILRLEWQDINWAEGVIRLKGKVTSADGKVSRVTKTGKRRVVPITPALRAWLEPLAEKSGKLWPHSEPLLYKLICRTDAEVIRGYGWKHNALRHSFISYRLADVKNENQVALESGNSPSKIHSNYKALVTEAQAAEFFALRPEPAKAGKVVRGVKFAKAA